MGDTIEDMVSLERELLIFKTIYCTLPLLLLTSFTSAESICRRIY